MQIPVRPGGSGTPRKAAPTPGRWEKGGVRLFSVLMLPRNATDNTAPPPDALLLKSFIRRAIEGQRSSRDDPHHIRFKCAARPEALDPQVSHSSPHGRWKLAW